MKFYRKSQETVSKIIEAFKEGNLPEPLSQIFISRSFSFPSASWSFLNQFSCALSGCTDARGYRQWQEVGRFVNKGEQARAHILVPLIKKIKDDDSDEGINQYVYGFSSCPVFDVSQTDGDPLPESAEITDDLPLIEVAEAWNIDVTVYSGQKDQPLGRFSYGVDSQTIAIGVVNLSTWAHELIHAADFRLGNLNDENDENVAEIVAELGGATLLSLIGEKHSSDIGGAWEYIEHYADSIGIPTISACSSYLDRVCNCVDLILEAAKGISHE